MSEPVKIKVPVVIDEVECQVLIVTNIPLNPPAFEIKDVDKEVLIDNCEVNGWKIIINGTLRKNINFKTRETEDTFDGNRRVCGDVRHCTVYIPFSCFADINWKERNKGGGPLDCQVEWAGVVAQKQKLIDPTDVGTFNTLEEKDVVKICVKVTQTEQIWVNTKYNKDVEG